MFQMTQDFLTAVISITATLAIGWIIVEYFHFATLPLPVRPAPGPIPPGDTFLGRVITAAQYILNWRL